MLGEAIYFIFSNIAVVLAIGNLVNVWSVKNRQMTILGEKVEPKSPGYDKLMALTSPKAVIIASLLTLVFVGNLAYEVLRLVNVGTPSMFVLLLIAPCVTLLVFFDAIARGRRNARSTPK